MSHDNYLTADQIHRALTMRDLTDAARGEHAMQVLLQSVVDALQAKWGSTVRSVRSIPIVPVRENYDRLGYDPADVTRDADGTWRIRAGARVRVRLTMVAESQRTNVALVDPLPAGLVIVNPELAT